MGYTGPPYILVPYTIDEWKIDEGVIHVLNDIAEEAGGGITRAVQWVNLSPQRANVHPGTRMVLVVHRHLGSHDPRLQAWKIFGTRFLRGEWWDEWGGTWRYMSDRMPAPEYKIAYDLLKK